MTGRPLPGDDSPPTVAACDRGSGCVTGRFARDSASEFPALKTFSAVARNGCLIRPDEPADAEGQTTGNARRFRPVPRPPRTPEDRRAVNSRTRGGGIVSCRFRVQAALRDGPLPGPPGSCPGGPRQHAGRRRPLDTGANPRWITSLPRVWSGPSPGRRGQRPPRDGCRSENEMENRPAEGPDKFPAGRPRQILRSSPQVYTRRILMSKEETTKVGAASTFRPIGAEGDRTLNLSIAKAGALAKQGKYSVQRCSLVGPSGALALGGAPHAPIDSVPAISRAGQPALLGPGPRPPDCLEDAEHARPGRRARRDAPLRT